VSVQEAIREALEAWASPRPVTPPDSLQALQGSLADVDVEKLLREEREAELAKDQRWQKMPEFVLDSCDYGLA
jgi:hypothetical protein